MYMNLYYILLIILLLVVFVMFMTNSEKYKQYPLICLTNKPVGHLTQPPAITYWKNLLSDSKKRQKIDSTISPNIVGISESNNFPETKSPGDICSEYYKNPVLYCKNNPGKRPCPNHWIF